MKQTINIDKINMFSYNDIENINKILITKGI